MQANCEIAEKDHCPATNMKTVLLYRRGWGGGTKVRIVRIVVGFAILLFILQVVNSGFNIVNYSSKVKVSQKDDIKDSRRAGSWESRDVHRKTADVATVLPGSNKLGVMDTIVPTQGMPWPMPKHIQFDPKVTLAIDRKSFRFEAVTFACDIMWAAVDRQSTFLGISHSRHQKRGRSDMTATSGGSSGSPKRGNATRMELLDALYIDLEDDCYEEYPSFLSQETYNLTIQPDGTATLYAPQIWGVVRGLETFGQLVFSRNNQLQVKPVSITDEPRFRHRGILLDTGRHFLSKETMFRNLDAMAMSKLNVLHWHMTDDQAFPFLSAKFPELAEKGAFDASAVYTGDDVRQVVEHARLRGIRVIPEFDTPGHSHSWAKGRQDIATSCGKTRLFGQLDPTKNATYVLLRGLMEELMAIFPDFGLHLGGNDVSLSCWKNNVNIASFMKTHGFGGNYSKLLEYYYTQLLEKLKSLYRPHDYMVWDDVVANGIKLPSDVIVQISSTPGLVKPLVELGHTVIFSACWHLNQVKNGMDWTQLYLCDPAQYLGDANATSRRRLIGGEACMWGDHVDDTNLLTTLWPRAIAVAEKLWSHPKTGTEDLGRVKARFEEHRCRMVRRGVPASPVNGPGHCRPQ